MPRTSFHAVFPEARWALVPRHLRRQLLKYLDHGTKPGPFLNYLLAGDVMGALRTCSAVEQARLGDVLVFLRDYLPPRAHGSADAVADWTLRGGFTTLDRREAYGRWAAAMTREPRKHVRQPADLRAELLDEMAERSAALLDL